jgi:hypothetical protein
MLSFLAGLRAERALILRGLAFLEIAFAFEAAPSLTFLTGRAILVDFFPTILLCANALAINIP